MNSIDYALKLELDGKAYYEKQAELSDDPRVKKIFEMLAGDEERHHKIISGFKSEKYGYKTTDTFKTTKNIFSDMIAKNEKFNVGISTLEVYRKAIEMEEESVRLYSDYAEKAEIPEEKKVLGKLAEEEKKHRVVLENLMEFIRKGDEWVESAEFSSLDEYDEFTQRDGY